MADAVGKLDERPTPDPGRRVWPLWPYAKKISSENEGDEHRVDYRESERQVLCDETDQEARWLENIE
jgi:hypothetical protein